MIESKLVKWLIAITFGIGVFTVVGKWVNSQPRVSTYSIESNFLQRIMNSKDKRKHAIIQLQSINNRNSNCTAFVISDVTALTAGHCMVWTKNYIDYDVPKFLAKSEKVEREVTQLIAELMDTCHPNNFRCMSQINALKANLAKELSARNKLLKAKPDKFNIMSIDGLDTGIDGIAFSKNKKRDYGFIHADFKNFKKIPIRSGWHVRSGDILKACGFFGSMLPPYCVDFEAMGNHGFDYKGKGIFVPGVSGGPVIDHHGYAAGIAVRVHKDFVVMTPIIGIVNILTEEQADKLRPKGK